jgi:hypothetical protein
MCHTVGGCIVFRSLWSLFNQRRANWAHGLHMAVTKRVPPHRAGAQSSTVPQADKRLSMNPIQRVARHARLTSYSYRDMDSPPFLVLFINSICNMKC